MWRKANLDQIWLILSAAKYSLDGTDKRISGWEEAILLGVFLVAWHEGLYPSWGT